jgi:hypothetical protein
VTQITYGNSTGYDDVKTHTNRPNSGAGKVHLHPSIRKTVRLAGTLIAEGTELPCTISAIKVSIPALDVWEYVRADVVDAPSALPDGGYELRFERRKMKTVKRNGCWSSGAL